jgi:RimJ/RimL family protein N-acetyltransferase
MAYILETARLRLREFTFEDAPFIIELLNSPGWLEFIGDRNVRTPEQAHDYLENGPMKSYRVNGYGLSMVERKEDGTPIGMCGVLNRDALECPDIGFAFLPAFHGTGYAFEIARATADYAKGTLGLHRIAAITVPHNKRSIGLLEKLGLKYIRPFTFPGSAEVVSLYGNWESITPP